MMRVHRVLLLAMVLIAGHLDARELMIVLDASNSMWGQINGEAKITIARQAMSGLIDALDNEDQVGLIAYGHRHEGDCQDVELIQTLSPLDRAALKQQINAIDPRGKTPITSAMNAAFDAIGSTTSNIILVSDGVETCDADPCAAVKAARDRGLDFKLQVIGFDVDQQTREQLSCMAEAGDGRLLTAADSEELVLALEQAGGVQSSAGIVSSVAGIANIEREGETLQQAQQDDEVFRQDQLRTSLEASLSIALLDGSILELDEDSLLTIAEYVLDPAANSTLQLLLGRLRATVTRTFSSRRESFRVATSNAVIGVQGTIFSTTFSNNVTGIFVEDGQVVVRHADPSVAGEVILNAGEYTRVVEDQPPEPATIPQLSVNVTVNGLPATAEISVTDRGREAASGSAPLIQPLHPGDYLVTATLEDGFSQADEVQLPADGLEHIVEITRAAPVTSVAISATTPTGAAPPANLDWMIINKATEEMIIPDAPASALAIELEPGNYDVLVTSDDYEAELVIEVGTAGANEFVVELIARTGGNGFSSPDSIAAGEILTFEWIGPAAEKDSIFIASPNMAENRYNLSNVHKVSDGSPAVLVAPAQPGQYEIRYFSRANGTVVFRKPLEVTPAQVSINVHGELVAGEEFTFDWTGPGTKGDLLFITSADLENSKYFTGNDRTHSVTGGSPGNLIAPVNPGNYEIRYYSRPNGSTLAKLDVSVAAHAVTIDAPRTVAPGAEFDFTWAGPDARGDFLFIAKPDLAANKYWVGAGILTKDGQAGKLTAPTEPGGYEIRYFSKRNGTMLAKRVFVVR